MPKNSNKPARRRVGRKRFKLRVLRANIEPGSGTYEGYGLFRVGGATAGGYEPRQAANSARSQRPFTAAVHMNLL